jgi:hypothetical protein
MAYQAAKYSADLAAGVLTDITNGGLVMGGAFVLTVCNRTTNANAINLAITTGAAPAPGDYFEYNATVDPSGTGGILRNWPIPMMATWRIYAQATNPGLSVTLLGAVS